MIKKIGISFILVLECSCMLLYFWRMSHDPDKIYWNSDGWTLFYHCSLMIPLMLLSLLLSASRQNERSIFDEYFLITIGIYNFMLIISAIAQYYNLIEHTYRFQISTGGIIVATILIVNAAVKNGYYK